MTAVYYERRVVDVRYHTDTYAGDSWVDDPVEYDAQKVLMTREAQVACSAPPPVYGHDWVGILYYSGYIDGVKTAIQLADALDLTSCSMTLYDPLTGEHVDDWYVVITGEDEETPVHGVMMIVPDFSGETAVYEITTAPGMYRFEIAYESPAGTTSTIVSGWIEIQRAIPVAS